MISLCFNHTDISDGLNRINNNSCISEYIKLYIASYGLAYDFQQCYLQYTDEKKAEISAFILRYNNQIYVTSSDKADLYELSSFINGFENCTVFAEKNLTAYFSNINICYVMSKKGVNSSSFDKNIKSSDDINEISNLAVCGLSSSEREDFFLNTSYQLRHNLLKAHIYFLNGKPISTAAVAITSDSKALITFVYTDIYFRGNGYSKAVLDVICTRESIEYLLLCEEKNIKFYEKCGFEVIDRMLKIPL